MNTRSRYIFQSKHALMGLLVIMWLGLIVEIKSVWEWIFEKRWESWRVIWSARVVGFMDWIGRVDAESIFWVRVVIFALLFHKLM